MCGIFGYKGNKNALSIVHTGLKRLEYRGYDSWGTATIINGKFEVNKQIGELNPPEKTNEKSHIAIGHTRWATHGGITVNNAHPHLSSDKRLALAHNGIVENYAVLKEELQKDFKFKTQTDTEVILRLIEKKLTKEKDLVEAVRQAFNELEGRNTIIVLDKETEMLICAKKGSPLVIGFTQNPKDIIFSSDTYSFVPWVNSMVLVEDDQIAIFDSKLHIIDAKTGDKVKIKKQKLKIENLKADKEGFDHFMIKEIHESPYVIQQVINQDINNLIKLAKAVRKAKNVYTLASGSAGAAAAQIGFFITKYGEIRTKHLVGAEAYEEAKHFNKDDIIIAPSQSGETADVLEILEQAKEKKAKVASYVNMLGSTMTRISDYKFQANAGPEICVMTTKVFVSQVSWGYLLGKTIKGEYDDGVKNLKNLKKTIEKYLEDKQNIKNIKQLAKKLANNEHIFLLAKGQNLNISFEGMVKIIEGAYKHAHAIPAGDLKHYAITLMEKGVPVVFTISEDEVKNDVINAVNEIKARGATAIVLGKEEHPSYDEFIKIPDAEECDSIMNLVALQLLAYFMTVELGNNVDKPRNIAKSVTVK